MTDKGIQSAEDKLEAIRNMKTPSNVKELQTFHRMVTYLNRYFSKLAILTAPLREITKQNARFKWEACHQQALTCIKKNCVQRKSCPTTTCAQLHQQFCNVMQAKLEWGLHQANRWKKNERVIAMTLRSSTARESRYSNIERECLAVTHGLEKFEYHLLGRKKIVETDHSTLEQIFKKNLAKAPPHLQRMLLKCLRVNVQVKYKPVSRETHLNITSTL